MTTVRYPEDVKKLPPCVAALGFFDGVHIGHRALIAMAKDAAKEKSLPLAVFTFPSESPSLKSRSARLTSTEEKCGIFASLGVQTLILCDFDAVKNLSPEEFVGSVLIDRFNVQTAVTGSSFRFGKNAKGTPALLSSLLKERGASHLLCPDCKLNGVTVSSAAIRSALEGGNVKKASEMLGRPIALTGEVSRGIGLAHEEGFPTVNTDSDKLPLLRPGVYSSLCEADGKIRRSITNVGTCPTFGGRPLHAETHLLDFEGDLYGQKITVSLLDFMRPEKQFSSNEELFLQIKLDIQARKVRKD